MNEIKPSTDEIKFTLTRHQAEGLVVMLADYDAFKNLNIKGEGALRDFKTAWDLHEIWCTLCQRLIYELQKSI